MPRIEDTLKDRGAKYGEFTKNAQIAQDLKCVLRGTYSWRTNQMSPFMMEALEVIAQKISRILAGDPWYADNWHDIAGYATLVEKELVRGSAPRQST